MTYTRFSLRSIFVLMGIAALLCAYVAHLRINAARHFSAAASICNEGGQVAYGYQFDSYENWNPNTDPPIPGWIASIVGAYDYGGTQVYFMDNATDREVAGIADLQNVRYVDLSFTDVSDHGLAVLRQVRGTETLYLDGTSVSDQGLTILQYLPNLKELSLEYTQITDDGVREIAKVSNLKRLNLSRTLVTDVGLRELSQLDLELLSLYRTSVTDEGVRQFERNGRTIVHR